jgi:hypothetical protein
MDYVLLFVVVVVYLEKWRIASVFYLIRVNLKNKYGIVYGTNSKSVYYNTVNSNIEK